MKMSGGVTIPNSEVGNYVAVTVVFTEGGDVEKITNQQGEVLYEAEGGGGGGHD